MAGNEPLDKGTVKFYFDFITNGEGKIEIAEPVGFDAANFVVLQDDKRYGRDVSFSGGDVDYEFYNKTFPDGLTHQFILLREYFRKYGFESQVKFILEVNGVDYVIGDLDWETVTTDQVEFFKFKILQENEQAIIKRRKKIDVNLFSDKDLDGNTITPISPETMLLKAKPVFEITSFALTKEYSAQRGNQPLQVGYVNPYSVPLKTELKTVHVPEFIEPINSFQADKSYILQAERSLKNIKLEIKDVQVEYVLQTKFDIADYPFELLIDIGETGFLDITNRFDLITIDLTHFVMFSHVETTPEFEYNVYKGVINLTVDVDDVMLAGEKLWCFFNQKNQLAGSDFGDTYFLDFKQSEGSIIVSATSTDVNSISKSIRLIDAMKQVCKSIGGFNVTAPLFDVGGELYDQRLFDGNMLRGFDDKPFYLKFDEILEAIQEFNCDYEITENGEIFFGTYDDFYTDQEIGRFENLPNESFEKSINKRYAINDFTIAYKDFEQDREETDTLQSVHTKSSWSPPNKYVENNKQIELPFIRDPFLLESTRIRSIEVKEGTSLSQDNKKFLIDAISSSTPFQFTEVLLLNHSFDSNGDLKLLNNGSFSWERIGLQETVDFEFVLNNVNIENYRIVEVKPTLLTLSPQSPVAQVEGLLSTSITYFVRSTNITNRGSEGFDFVSGVVNPEGYSNLNFTLKRDILNYWGRYLNTSANYHRNGIIRNTFFKNNKELTTRKTGESANIREGDDINVIDLKDRILTPVFYKTEVLANYGIFSDLVKDLRTKRGYITIVDNRREEIKIHPSYLEFMWNDGTLKIEGEERYQVIDFLTITCVNGIITIRQIGFEDVITEKIIPKITGDDVELFGKNMLLLAYPMKYDKISINGQTASSVSELLELFETLC